MRYFLITYIKRPDGKIDESTEVTKRLRPRDYRTVNIVMDFQDMKIQKATMDGQAIPHDWDRIHDYFYQHYKATFDRLHRDNGREVIIDNASNNTVDTTDDTTATV